jgi:PAS domain S-box-containing protein
VRRIAALCLLAIAAADAATPAAQPGIAALDAHTRRLELREQLEVLRDDGAALSFDDLLSDAVVFRPAEAGDISHGYTASAWWYRVTLRNDGGAGAGGDWVLELDYPPLDEVDFYVARGGAVTHVATGDQRPIAPGQLDYRDYAVPVRVAPGERVQVHVRVLTGGSHQAPLTLWSQDAFIASAARESLAYGVFFGVMGVMAVYNLIVLLFVRERSYLYYIGTLVFFTLFQLNQSGYMYRLLQPHLGGAFYVNNLAVMVFGSAMLVSFLLFARAFLETRLHAPRTHRVLAAVLALVVAFFAASFALPFKIATSGLALLGAVSCIVFIGAGVTALRANVHMARFYLAAWSVFVVGILVKVLELFGLLPPSAFTAHAWQAGGVVTVTLLSLALADRINLERKDKIAAQDEALALREQAIGSLARYQRIVETVLEGIFETDAQARELVSANPALAAMLGYAGVDEMKRAIRDLRREHVVDASAADAMFQRLREDDQLSGYELQLRRRNGSEFWAAISMRQLLDDAGQPVGALGIVQDISERRERDQLTRARAAAEAATSAKSDFLAKMSHELRTPMNAIIGFSDLALRSDSDARRLEHLGHIRSASRSLLHIINDILDLSKIEAGKLTLERRDFHLPAVLNQVTALLAQQAADKGLTLTVSRAAQVPLALVGDPLRLEQILVNLVGNAVKFTERGEIELSVELASATDRRARLRFMVRDTGIGLTSEEQSRLFSAFSQADAFSTRRHGGTGLGLAISKQLVEKMGGRIAVESRPGVGSVFLFTAEFGLGSEREVRAPSPATTTLAAPPAPRTAVLRGARVLLVEDNPLNRQLAQEILQPTGLVLDTAENGPDAIAAVRQAAYNAVLMDVQMPGMDGLETTRRIRAMPGGATLPIVALTANAMERDRQDCLGAGMNDFLSKPVDADQLLVTLSHWVGGAVAPLATAAMRPGDTGPQPVATPPPTLPPLLPGIDIASAVKRLGGRENLVLDVLHGMLRQYAAGARGMHASLAQGKTDDARIAAHTLKGLAATAGCMRLAAAAKDAEAAIRAGSRDLDSVLAEVQAAFEEVQTSAARLPPGPAKARAASAAPIDVDAEIARLGGLLRTSDSAAQEQVELLLPALRGRFPQEVLDRLARAIQSFDFETATEVLETLAGVSAPGGAAPREAHSTSKRV